MFGGSGFLSKATNHLGLRGHVPDTKSGLRCYVTQSLVITRIRQDVSAGKCVAGMLSPPRQNTWCSSTVMSASDAIASLLRRARMPWIFEYPCDSWLWDVPKINVFGSPCRKRTLFLIGTVDSRGLHRIARKSAWTGGRCSVTGQKHVHPKKSASRSKLSFSRPPSTFVFRAWHGSHRERTTIPENTSFPNFSLNKSKIFLWELLTLRLLWIKTSG